MDQDFIRCKITEYTGRAGALRCCGKDAKPVLLRQILQALRISRGKEARRE